MILALDPGSVKTGVAVVYKNGSLARKKVIQTEDFEKEVNDFMATVEVVDVKYSTSSIGDNTIMDIIDEVLVIYK